MTKKYERPVHDPNSALAPRVPPLDVKESQVLEILRKRPGRLFTISEILMVLKENIDIPDNRAAAIFALVRLEEAKKIYPDIVVPGKIPEYGWCVKPPDPPLDGAPKQ